MINKRSRNIILEIFKRGSIRISELAVMFKVTQRTVRMDLEEIDYFLKDNGFEPLLHDSKKGISFSSANMKTSLIYKLINQKEIVTASFTKDERRLEILYYLAMHPQAVKIEDLAELLLVSKSTVVKDLEYLKEYLAKENFHIAGSLDGIRLLGNEFALRSTLVKIFMETMDKQTVLELIKLISGEDKLITYKVHWRLFEQIDLKLILHISEVLRGALSIHLSDRQYLQIIGNLCIMLKRNEIACHITESEHVYASRMSKFVVEKIFALLQKTWNLPKQEKGYVQYIVYLCCHELYMMDGKEKYISHEESANHIISFMKTHMELENPKQLYQDVVEEIRMMMIEDELRIPQVKNLITLQNEQYEEIFQLVKASPFVLPFHNRKMNDDDYWRITLPFIANLSQHAAPKKILIVSDKSKSLIAMMIRRLQMLFDIEIVGISGYANMQTYLQLFPIDCIISTMKVTANIDMVQVHPLLNEDSIQLLKQHLHTHTLCLPRECEHHEFAKLEQWFDDVSIEEVLSQVDQILFEKGYTTISLHRIVMMNMCRQQSDYMIQRGNLILNVRNHEVIQENVVVISHIKTPLVIDDTDVHSITFIAGINVQDYLRYMEAYV